MADPGMQAFCQLMVLVSPQPFASTTLLTVHLPQERESVRVSEREGEALHFQQHSHT